MRNDFVLMAVAAALVGGVAWWITRKPAGPAVAGGALGSPDKVMTGEVFNPAVPGSPGYGWRYFSDGVTIDPFGVYRLNGEVVWTPGAMA